ncbi:ubiquitin-conjugating enzyme E2 T [Patella vulgata]|uniref:ubiquitin-conjugating enzyme E2 T n=1 Tax=Patella vulgata TaxID=6465 RepID=UPI002180978D|nr:ubiquitin-conjugating enzyme E2 T [Patella vulgata]
MALIKEVKKLVKNIESLSNGQAHILEMEDTMDVIKIEIKPSDGLYKGGTFIFKIRLHPNFPTDAPNVVCLTPIYHPNIDTTYDADNELDDSNICINMLDDWEPAYGLDGCINAILFLFYYPEIEDSLSPYIDAELSPEEFAENVRKSLQGVSIEDILFPRNLDVDDEIPMETTTSEETSQNVKNTQNAISTVKLKEPEIEECKKTDDVEEFVKGIVRDFIDNDAVDVNSIAQDFNASDCQSISSNSSFFTYGITPSTMQRHHNFIFHHNSPQTNLFSRFFSNFFRCCRSDNTIS